MEMLNYIRNLLIEYNTIVIPGLGAIQSDGYVVTHDKSKQVFTNLIFKPKLNKDDGKLAKALVEGEKISYDVALETIKQFVLKCREDLEANNSVHFKGIGFLCINEAGKYYIKPETKLKAIIPDKTANEMAAIAKVSGSKGMQFVMPVNKNKKSVFWLKVSIMALFFIGGTHMVVTKVMPTNNVEIVKEDYLQQ